MKRKYADYYYSVKKTDKGYTWSIYSKYEKGSEVLESSLQNKDKDDQYLETETAARTDAIHAIQDHYS